MKIMKTTNNTVINSIMRTYLKYICAVLLVIGTSAHAWAGRGTFNLPILTGTLVGCTYTGPSYIATDHWDENAVLTFDIADGYDPSEVSISVTTDGNTYEVDQWGDYRMGWSYIGRVGTLTLYASFFCHPDGRAMKYGTDVTINLSVEEACTSRTLTFASATVNKTYGNSAGKYQSYTLSAEGGTETWESSNTSVATVNNSGNVTIVGAGSTTITAKRAVSGDYCAVEGSYTLNVAAISPTVNNTHLTKGTVTSTNVAYSGGQVSNKGGADITRYGYVLGTSSSVEFGTALKKTYTSSGVTLNTDFASKTLSDLTPNTTYYVRAFAYNGTAYGYGTAVSFTTLQRYTIIYNNNGGEGTIDNQYKDYGVAATLNAGTNFSRTGYTLSRWDSNSSGTGNSYALSGSYTTNGNVTLYAVWTPNPYTITLNNQDATSGGTASISVTYNANTNLTGTPAITVPTKTGYTFGGYYTGIGGEGNQIIAANGNVNASVDGFTDASKNWIYANGITLYAKWTANTITLTLDKNGVTGTDGSASVKYDATALESGTSHATNSDGTKHLVGYFAEAGTTTKVLESNGAFAASSVTGYITDGKWSCTTSPTTLYAKWAMTTYTVTFNMHDHGEAIAAQEVESGSKVATPAEPEVGDAVGGWRFLGWFTDNGAGSATSTNFDFANTTITANTTIHARWEEISYSTAYKAWCEPDITISGDIHLTSVNGIAVYATSTTNNLLRIQSNDLAGVNKLEIKYLDADNGDAEVAKGSSLFRLCNDGTENYNVADGSQIDVSASNTYDQTFSISYTPTDYNVSHHYKLQITMKHGTNVLKTVTHDLYGRSLPEEFVIATKGNDNIWYALPNTIVDNNHAVSPIRITVNDATTPTAASYAPTTTVFKGDGRYNNAANRYAVRFTDGVLNNEDKLNHLQISSSTDTHYPWLSYSGSSTNQDWWLKSTDCSAYELKVPTSGATSAYKLGIYSGSMGYFSSVTSGSIFLLPVTNKIVDNPAIVTEWGKKSVILDVDAQTASGAQARLGAGAAEKGSFGQTLTSVKGAASKYNYTVSFSTTDFSTHKGELLYIDWLDNEDNVISTSAITIPWIIASDGTMSSIDATKGHWNTEVHVLPGATLTADGGSFGSSAVDVKQLEIYPGATVNVTTGTLSVTDLVLRNGWTRAGGKSYDVARLYITPSTGSLAATRAYADWYIDYDQYYPVAVPWSVTTSGMSYKNSNSTAQAGVIMRYYNGANRATNGQAGVDDGANWTQYSRMVDDKTYKYPETLTPGLGYAMTAKRPTGKAFSIIRMPLTIPAATWTTNGEQGEVSSVHKDQVTITAHGVSDLSKPRYTVGWNFIANPYMAIYQGPITHSVDEDYDVAYVNIPDLEFKNYGQYPVGALGKKLLPASGFFIQAAADGVLTFGTTNRKASAPSFIKEETTPVVSKQKAYIVLNNEDADDMMGLIISEKYTEAYEINADLEKLLGDGNNLKTYMRYSDMNMAYVAINSALAQEWIPVTVQVPEGGEYTFSLHEASVVDELEGIYLIDYAAGNVITNLINDNYSFGSAPGTITNRFAINAIVGEHKIPTGVDAVSAGADLNSDKPFKFVWHDKVYILYRGVIYDATGKRVSIINR